MRVLSSWLGDCWVDGVWVVGSCGAGWEAALIADGIGSGVAGFGVAAGGVAGLAAAVGWVIAEALGG